MAKTFTDRSNARRAAKRMIETGTAPGSDFSLQTDDSGLISIVWQTADVAAPDKVAIETEIVAASGPAKAKKTNRSTEFDEAAANGIMPEKPVITSATNQHYQKHLDRLAELAAAGDWDAIGAYEVKGSNTYAKLVARYRDRLVAAHAAGSAA